MGQHESTMMCNNSGYVMPISSQAQQPTQRVDMRWSRVTMDQLHDEEFLTKQLRRFEALSIAHHGGNSLRSGLETNGKAGVFRSVTQSSQASIQQRLLRNGPKQRSKEQDDENDDDEKITWDKVESQATLMTRDGKVDQAQKERDLMTALHLLGDMDQPELAALMQTHLHDLLRQKCAFSNPFYDLLALKRQILRNVFNAVAVQHQQQRMSTKLTSIIMDKIQDALLRPQILPRMRSSRMVGSSRALSARSGVQSPDMSSGIMTAKPKERVSREAVLGIQVIQSLLLSLGDPAIASITQKKQFLDELFILLQNMEPLSLAPKRITQSTGSKGISPSSDTVTSLADSIRLLDEIQHFLLDVSTSINSKMGPVSPKVRVGLMDASEIDLKDCTNAMNCLLFLAGARGSLRDLLIALKILLDVDSKDVTRQTPRRSPHLMSPLVAPLPLLKTVSGQNSEVHDGEKGIHHSTKVHTDISTSPESILNKVTQDRESISSNGHADKLTQVSLNQVKRKYAPKGLSPKVIFASHPTTTTVNLSVTQNAMNRRLTYSSGGTSLAGTIQKTKQDHRILLSGETSPTSEFHDRNATVVVEKRCRNENLLLTARCPTFQSLHAESVLSALADAKTCSLPSKSSAVRSANYLGFRHCGINHPTSGCVDSDIVPGDDDIETREVWSCGQNSYGELGHGDTTSRKNFERIEALQQKDIIQVSAGNEHSIALSSEGTVFSCGYNDNGQCGLGVTTRVSHMTEIQKLNDLSISQIHAYNGCEHSVFVTESGEAATCGYNYRGQLGLGNTASESVPKIVWGLESKSVRLVSCSYYHTIFACEASGGGRQFVYTFGRNDYGQLGHDDAIDRKVPQNVDALKDHQIISVACGQYHTMVVTATGKLFGFGKNDYGQLGIEDIENQLVPVQIRNALERQVCLEVRCGYYHTVVLCGGAHLYAFGRNDYGQLGLGKPKASASSNLQLQQQRFALPQLIIELEGKEIVRFACGCYHSVAVSDNGALYVFGRNNHGQLGTGDTTERLYPFPIDDFLGKRVAMVAAGFYHTIVLTGGREEEKADQDKNENDNSGDSSIANAITFSSILSTPFTRQVTSSSSRHQRRTSTNKQDPLIEDAHRISLLKPADDSEEEEYRDEDNVKCRGENASPSVTTTDDGDYSPLKTPYRVESVDIAVVMLAHLDRLCRTVLPKQGTYPVLQHPCIKSVEVLFPSSKSSHITSAINTHDAFEGCFELFTVQTCSSTFQSLCALIVHLSSMANESIAQAQSRFVVISPGNPASISQSSNSNHLQIYLLLVCFRLLKANIAQLLRSGYGSMLLIFAECMNKGTNDISVSKGSSDRSSTEEMKKMLSVIREIRQVLISLIDMQYHNGVWFIDDNGATNSEISMKVAAEAVDTLMQGFELFFPCQCAQRQFILHVLVDQTETNYNAVTLMEGCKQSTWCTTILPKSRVILKVPVLKRMMEDTLLVKFLPLTLGSPLAYEKPITIKADRASFPPLSFVTEIYKAFVEQSAGDFSRFLGTIAAFDRNKMNEIIPTATSSSLFGALCAIQKHISSWAASCQCWYLTLDESTRNDLTIQDRITSLVDRAFRVDENDLENVPGPWRCFIELAFIITAHCCDIFVQVLCCEPMPSPSSVCTRQTNDDGLFDEMRTKIFEVVEASLVGQFLPSFIECLLMFSSNPLFAASMMPNLKALLRLLDDFNQRYPDTGELKTILNDRDTAASTSAVAYDHSVDKSSRRTTGHNVELKGVSGLGANIDDAIALKWNMRLEKDLAVLTAEMGVTLTIGDPFFKSFSSHDHSTSISARWFSSPLFSGGLDSQIIRRSIQQQSSDNEKWQFANSSRTVRHMPFTASTDTVEEWKPFSLILPPSICADENDSIYWCDEGALSYHITADNYAQVFGITSIQTFLQCLTGEPVNTNFCKIAQTLCCWIRDNYAKTDSSYRMILRQEQTANKTGQFVQLKAAGCCSGEIIEGAFFAALLHHNGLAIEACHFARVQRNSSSPPRRFLQLWKYVADLRRHCAAKKMELKNSIMLQEEDDASNRIALLYNTIRERCQILLYTALCEDEEHQHLLLDGRFIAPYDPALSYFSSSFYKSSIRSVKLHMETTYTDNHLPFLAAFPLSKWKKLRMLVHVAIRWKHIGVIVSRTNIHKSGISMEVFDYVTSNEPVSTDYALHLLLVEPCRRLNCSTRGLQLLWELLTVVSTDAIRLDVLHQVTQFLIFQPREHSTSVAYRCASRLQNAGLFYNKLHDQALSEFMTSITQLIVDKASLLLGRADCNSDEGYWLLILLLSCWSIHFRSDHFEFVNDIGILALLDDISHSIHQWSSPQIKFDDCSVEPQMDMSLSRADNITGINRKPQADTNSLITDVQLLRLKEVIWVLFRSICVDFATQILYIDQRKSSKSISICIPTIPVLIEVFERIYNESANLTSSYILSASNVTDEVLLSQHEAQHQVAAVPGTLRRSFEIIQNPQYFSPFRKGLMFLYEKMITPSSSTPSTAIPMSPLLKPNEYSITTWIYVDPIMQPRSATSQHLLVSPRSLFSDRKLVFLRGNEREIAPYLLLVPDSSNNWHLEVGLLRNPSGTTIPVTSVPKHLAWERMTSKESLRSGTWVHVGIVIEISKIRLYINGILDSQRSITACYIPVWAAGEVDLPFHFGKIPAAFCSESKSTSTTPTRETVSSSIQLLRASFMMLNGALTTSSEGLENIASSALGQAQLECFRGWLSHFRFHNRSLSPIHVRVVFDEKKENTIGSVSSSIPVNDKNQERKLLELHALLLVLSLSSEGQVHFASNFRKWFLLLLRSFLGSASFRLQQSTLRVLCAILPLRSPSAVSQVLLHPDDDSEMPRGTNDVASTRCFGFSECNSAFVQQLFRLIGCCICNPLKVPQSEHIAIVMPWTLWIKPGVQGAVFAGPPSDLMPTNNLRIGMQNMEQSMTRQNLALANELIRVLELVSKHKIWKESVDDTVARVMMVGNLRNNSDISSGPFFRFGEMMISADDIKNIEAMGCLYYLSGTIDFTRPGANVQVQFTRELATVVGMESSASVPTLSAKHKPVLAYVRMGNQNRMKRNFPMYNGLRNTESIDGNYWYHQVSTHYNALKDLNRNANDVSKGEQNTSRGLETYVWLNAEDILPVDYSTNRPLSTLCTSRFTNYGDVSLILIKRAAWLLPRLFSFDKDILSWTSSSTDRSITFLITMQSGTLLLKSLSKSVISPQYANKLHEQTELIETVLHIATSIDMDDTFSTLVEMERRLWLLRQRVYNVLVDLEDEADAELACALQSMEMNATRHDTVLSIIKDSSLNPENDMDEDKRENVPQLRQIEPLIIDTEVIMGSDPQDDGSGYEHRHPVLTGDKIDDEEDEENEDDDDDDDDDEEGEDEDEECEDEDDEDDDEEESRSEFVEELMLMGFPEEWCVLALKQTENDIVSASAWIVDNLEYLTRLQSSLDKQKERGRDTPRLNEEEDDIAPDESDSKQQNVLFVDSSSCSETIQDSEHVVRSGYNINQPPLTDKEMGRKVFGEMYFPLEEGGYMSSIKRRFLKSWRDDSVETKLGQLSRSTDPPLDESEQPSAQNVFASFSDFEANIEQMDLPLLVQHLIRLERSVSILYARQCVATVLFHLSQQNTEVLDIEGCKMDYNHIFKLLKLVLFRGHQFDLFVRGSSDQQCQERTPETVLLDVVSRFIVRDSRGFTSAAFEFCLKELEHAASNKTYETTQWTHRNLQRSDKVVYQEPAIELVIWVLNALLADNVHTLESFTTAGHLIRHLRRLLGATNLSLKFLLIHTISRILRKLAQENAETLATLILESGLVFAEFLQAARLRHSRELVQHRLIFSLYLQAYIEILYVIREHAGNNVQLAAFSAPVSQIDGGNLSLSSLQSMSVASGSDDKPFSFDRKRCRSSLLTISDDSLSASYSGNEMWKAVCTVTCFSTGVHSWIVRIEKSNTSYLFIGVATRRANLDSFLGADEHSWGYIGDKALYYQRNRIKTYGESFGEGDSIGVHLDCEHGTLSFSKNGVNLGIAFDNIVGEVYPAVAFYSRHQKVSLINDEDISSTFNNAESGGNDSLKSVNSVPSCDSGGVEECLVVCEMMSDMIQKKPIGAELLDTAYNMTLEWLEGSKKFITTRAGKPLWVDVRTETCKKLGFQPNSRVRTSRGNGTIIGIAENRLWVQVDGEYGAWFFHPSKLRSLALLTVEKPGTESGLDLCSSPNDGRLSTPRRIINSKEEFTELVHNVTWNLRLDRELIRIVNEYCESASISPWNVSYLTLLTLVKAKYQDLESVLSFILQQPEDICEKLIVARFGLLRFFNLYFARVIGFFDLTWYYYLPETSLLPCELVSKCRGSIFVSVKNDFFTQLMEKTANAPKKSDDDYDYPDDLPQILLNRPKAAAAKCHPGTTKSLFLSLFGQAFDELHFLPLKKLRMVYSHPMDDGQLRSFKVKFEGEGVDDYGGPYREFFSQFFAEIQMIDANEGEDNTRDGNQAEHRHENHPVSCMLPFLLPCPNWRNGVGANREKFVLNAALLSKDGQSNRFNQGASQEKSTSVNDEIESEFEKQQLYGEMFFFFGQMLGICLRTRVCVRLDLASSVWKQIVGEDDQDDESVLEFLKETDFVAFTLWKTLKGILNDYNSLMAPSLSETSDENCRQQLQEQLAAMDLTFTTYLSDGRLVDLCENGSETPVTIENLKTYLKATLRARSQESHDVANIIKQGLNSILPVTALSLLTWQEIEKRVCGVAEVDVNLLKQNTEYDEDLSAEDGFIQRFWRVLESLDDEDRRAFLRFVWARSRLPVGTAQFHQKFKIQSLVSSSNGGNGDSGSGSGDGDGGWMDSQLPKSHTCFFALQLPRYSSDEICKKQLLYAIRNCVEMDGDFRLADTEMTGWTDINPNDQLRF